MTFYWKPGVGVYWNLPAAWETDISDEISNIIGGVWSLEDRQGEIDWRLGRAEERLEHMELTYPDPDETGDGNAACPQACLFMHDTVSKVAHEIDELKSAQHSLECEAMYGRDDNDAAYERWVDSKMGM